MSKQKLFLILIALFFSISAFTQGFQITPPKLEFDGKQLLISYDVINKNEGDQFYVWVEIEKKNGEKIKMKALTGDVGDKIKVGMNKKIYWTPERDSVFLDEDVSVEVKAEKYTKSFNKSSMVLLSTVMPGLGQTKISNGKPWWLTGVITYGALAGGIISYQNYVSTYDSYNKETDGKKRGEFLAQAQKQKNLSTALIATVATLWIGNLIWVSAIPNKYQPLKNNIKLSLEKAPGFNNGTTLLSMRLTF
jgi:hypothetical protein